MEIRNLWTVWAVLGKLKIESEYCVCIVCITAAQCQTKFGVRTAAEKRFSVARRLFYRL
jgi:hypothetical protein